MAVASASDLVERAIAAAGSDDLGADGWQVGLEQLIAAARTDLGDDPDATNALEGMFLGRLTSRLRVEAWYAAAGASEPAPVDGPLVIVGLPRSATTALHYLLSRDPQFRFPRMWEMAAPVPPPDAASERDDPRRVAAASRGGGDVRHISSADGPMEDVFIHALNFGNQEMPLPLPRYREWWRTADLTTTFAYQERVLRLLHSQRPPHRWLLKAPAYLFHLPEMSRHYRDARFVMTHRDPVVALPSTCSVVLEARRMLPSIAQDKAALGPEMVEHFGCGVEQAMRARAVVGEERFLDVGQADVERDPIGVAERIYEFAGLELSDDVRATMREWAAENQRGSRGAHEYTAEEFGLTVEGLRDTFAEYRERFAGYLAPRGGDVMTRMPHPRAPDVDLEVPSS